MPVNPLLCSCISFVFLETPVFLVTAFFSGGDNQSCPTSCPPTRKSTFENYFSAVLAEMMEMNRRVEGLRHNLENLKAEFHEETLPLSNEVYEDEDVSGFDTQELPTVDSDGWEWRE